MTAFATAFKTEVMRMARKETKAEVEALRKGLAAQRSETVTLKREVKHLAGLVRALEKKIQTAGLGSEGKGPHRKDQAPIANAGTETPQRKRRGQFGPADLTRKREELGVMKEAMARLLEVAPLTLARWEKGEMTPRAAQLLRIQAVLKMGKRAALAKLKG